MQKPPESPYSDSRTRLDNQLLVHPKRLQALRETDLMDTEREEAYDRLARLAAVLLNAPLTLISLVSENRQFFKASFGLPEPLATTRQIPIDESLCRYTMHGEPLIITDAQQDPLLKDHPATRELGIVAFLAVPLVTREGYTLGAFCAVDYKTRAWTKDEVEALKDLTAATMTEINLRTVVRQLEAESRSREQLVAILSHDLRNPLAAAKIATQLVARKNKEGDADLEQNYGIIIDNLNRADRLIQDILDTSRVRAGEAAPVLVRETLDLREVCRTILDDMSAIYGKRFVLAAPSCAVGSWNPDGIRRVLENLLTNAVKYGDPEKPITLTITLVPDSRRVEISVHNDGKPLSDEDQATLFDPFRRASEADGEKGWGLGLTSVRAIAEAHGGEVGVKSSRETGTCFTVVLPMA